MVFSHHRAFELISAYTAQVQQAAPVGDGLREKVKMLSDRAYCDAIKQAEQRDCQGWEAKVASFTFGQPHMDAHAKHNELMGKHFAFSAVLSLLDEAAAQPQTREGVKTDEEWAGDLAFAYMAHWFNKDDARTKSMVEIVAAIRAETLAAQPAPSVNTGTDCPPVGVLREALEKIVKLSENTEDARGDPREEGRNSAYLKCGIIAEDALPPRRLPMRGR